jgi:hypothetical protein
MKQPSLLPRALNELPEEIRASGTCSNDETLQTQSDQRLLNEWTAAKKT